MIEQVLLPNRGVINQFKRNPHLVDKEQAIADVEAQIAAAETRLDALIFDGYKIIERTPLDGGVNLILRKLDDPQPSHIATPEVMQAFQAYKDAVLARVGPSPYKSPESAPAQKDYSQNRASAAVLLANAVCAVIDPVFAGIAPGSSSGVEGDPQEPQRTVVITKDDLLPGLKQVDAHFESRPVFTEGQLKELSAAIGNQALQSRNAQAFAYYIYSWARRSAPAPLVNLKLADELIKACNRLIEANQDFSERYGAWVRASTEAEQALVALLKPYETLTNLDDEGISQSQINFVIDLAYLAAVDPMTVPEMSSDEAKLKYNTAKMVLPHLAEVHKQRVQEYIQLVKDNYGLGE